MTDLRDLEADRRQLKHALEFGGSREILEIAIAALDEIDRLKRLLVKPMKGGKWIAKLDGLGHWYLSEADAWAAVRKAANDGK